MYVLFGLVGLAPMERWNNTLTALHKSFSAKNSVTVSGRKLVLG